MDTAKYLRGALKVPTLSNVFDIALFILEFLANYVSLDQQTEVWLACKPPFAILLNLERQDGLAEEDRHEVVVDWRCTEQTLAQVDELMETTGAESTGELLYLAISVLAQLVHVAKLNDTSNVEMHVHRSFFHRLAHPSLIMAHGSCRLKLGPAMESWTLEFKTITPYIKAHAP